MLPRLYSETNLIIRDRERENKSNISISPLFEALILYQAMENLRSYSIFQVRPSPFGISKNKAKSIVRDKLDLEEFGGLYNLARILNVNLEKGVSAYDQPTIDGRRYYFGSNQYIVRSTQTSIALLVCLLAFMLLGVVLVYKGSGIMLAVTLTLVIIIAALFLFKHYLIPEKNVSVPVMVIRNGITIRISSTFLVVGEVVQLYAGETVPADGLFIPGRKLLICEPASLTGVEGGPVEICRERPHLTAGSTVLSGSAKMLVTAVGGNTAVEQMMRSHEHSMVLSGYGYMLVLATKIQEMLGVVFTAFKSALMLIIGGSFLMEKLHSVPTVAHLAIFVLILLVLATKFLLENDVHHYFSRWSLRVALKTVKYLSTAAKIRKRFY